MAIATMNADRSAVEAAAHAGLRSAPSMMNSTMIGMAAAIAESPSDPLIGAYTCVHISATLALMKLKCCASYIMSAMRRLLFVASFMTAVAAVRAQPAQRDLFVRVNGLR